MEAYRDAGGQLMGALEKTAEYAAGADDAEVESEVREDVQNARAQQELEKMMRGLGR